VYAYKGVGFCDFYDYAEVGGWSLFSCLNYANVPF